MERCYTYLFILLAFLLLLPLVLLFVCAFYFLAMFHVLRAMISVLIGRQASPEIAMQKPHFLERQAVAELQTEDKASTAP